MRSLATVTTLDRMTAIMKHRPHREVGPRVAVRRSADQWPAERFLYSLQAFTAFRQLRLTASK